MFVKNLKSLVLFHHRRAIRFHNYSLIFYCALSLSGSRLDAQVLPVGARSLGMGATYVALANTADAVFLNPGGLSQIDGIEVAFFYQKPFGLADVNYGTVALTMPVAGFRAGLGLLSLGNSLYSDQMISAVFSHHYLNKLYYGVAMSYWRTHIQSYGTAGALTFDLGMLFSVQPELRFGFMAQNINRAKRGSETRPQTLSAGIAVLPFDKLLLSLDVYKDVRFDAEIRFGVEVKPWQILALRAGVANKPDRFSAGFGLVVGRFKVDYAFVTHNDLGLTHQTSLLVGFGSKSQPKQSLPPVARAPVESTKAPQQPRLIFAERININTASIDELVELPGIGDSLARRIIRYRTENGLFAQKKDLQNVKGVGPVLFARIRDFITIGETLPE